MKRHLAGIKGDVAACMGVPYDVRFQMVKNLKEISRTRRDYGSLMLILSRIIRVINSIEIFMLLLIG